MTKLFRLVAGLIFGLSLMTVTGGQAGAAEEPLPGTYVLHSRHDGRCLDVFAGGAGPWVQAWGCNGQANQKFHYVPYPDGTVEIRTNDYWCVDGRWGKGASLERSPCTGNVGQRFWIVSLLKGVLIKSVQYPGLVWDVYDFGRGTKVQLWHYNEQPNQFWDFQRV